VPVGVVLVDQVNLLRLPVRRDDGSEGVDLHVDVGVEAEVPEIALLVGERRVDGRVVQEQQFAARVALVVLEHGFRQRMGHVRTVALGDEANPLVDGLLERHQAFLGTGLVVEADEFQLRPAEHPAPGVDLVDGRLDVAAAHLPLQRKRAALRIDVGDLDGVGRDGACGECTESGREQPDKRVADHGAASSVLFLR
jgi:hypothetical protein